MKTSRLISKMGIAFISSILLAGAAQADMLDSGCREAISTAQEQTNNENASQDLSNLEKRLAEFDTQSNQIKLEVGDAKDEIIQARHQTFDDARNTFAKLRSEIPGAELFRIATACTWH